LDRTGHRPLAAPDLSCPPRAPHVAKNTGCGRATGSHAGQGDGPGTDSWEAAASAAVATAAKSLGDLRIAEVVKLDMQLDDGKVAAYRAQVKVSCKYEGGE
jgi:hypothetical protein